MKLSEAKQLLKEIDTMSSAFKEWRSEHYIDEIEFDYKNAEERFENEVVLEAIKSLSNVKDLVSILNKAVVAEGYIYPNENGRYEISGTNIEFTCGRPMEIWDDDREMFVRTRIEHSGGNYYAYALGRDEDITGKLVRVRK
jgi:hypothetical protein